MGLLTMAANISIFLNGLRSTISRSYHKVGIEGRRVILLLASFLFSVGHGKQGPEILGCLGFTFCLLLPLSKVESRYPVQLLLQTQRNLDRVDWKC
jgi:hypothetical protein